MPNETQAGGLFANGQRVPLHGVHIQVKAQGVAAKVLIAQRYQNAEKVPVEAVYSFPLEESCAVTSFEAEIGGKRIAGKIEEREKAFEKYDEAMAQGHGAFLLDQDRPNIFTASVGNLLANQEATLRLGYVTELEQHGDQLRFLIPTTISPRYVPPTDLQRMDPAELDRINPPTVAGPVPYGLKLEVELELPGPAREVSCLSHPARVIFSGTTVKVILEGQNIQLDQDFVLNVTLQEPHKPSATVARDGDARVVQLNLFPDLKQYHRGPSEFVFVIDRSGSMEGESIEQARNALLLALRSMEEGDRFNIVGFGSSYISMFKTSAPYDQEHLDAATTFAERIAADLGGTELLAPLKDVLEQKTEMPRVVVLLTDGQVGNEAAVIELAGKHREHTRIFPFGIGRGVSEHLVKGLARASGGQVEMIHPNERIEPKVMKQFARMASPHLKNVKVDWGQLQTDLHAPAECPPLFDGDRLTTYARVTGGQPGEAAVTAEVRQANGETKTLRFPVFVDLEKPLSDSGAPALLARKAIQDLEEGRGIAVGGSNQQGRREDRVKKKILELALRYQLMSSETSFVAIEERVTNGQAQPAELRRIPIALTKGWVEERYRGITVGGSAAGGAAPGGTVGRARFSMKAPAAAYAPTPAPIPAPAQGEDPRLGGPLESGVDMDMLQAMAGLDPRLSGPLDLSAFESAMKMPENPKVDRGLRSSGPRDSHKVMESKVKVDPFLTLIKSQVANGSFPLTSDLSKAAGIQDSTAAVQQLGDNPKYSAYVLATVLVLILFETKFKDREVEWKMLADKARRWLAKQNVKVPAGFTTLEDFARSLIK